MSAFPALFIVRTSPVQTPEATPDTDDVRDTIVTVLDQLGWPAADFLRDIRRDEVDICHETPTDICHTYATIVEFTQIPTDMRRHGLSDPFEHCIHALYNDYDDIEVWIDAVGHPTPEADTGTDTATQS